jgi:crotonobetainyl-CoA:carnitine CoA-transferase CaiB-like acyl-CoA transferase
VPAVHATAASAARGQINNKEQYMDAPSEFSSPLSGTKVLELAHVQAGPICGMMLADMGAEVVKVESAAGDLFRVPMEGANFYNFNRNKQAIALDLKSEAGVQIALKLAEEADVLVENFLPGALDKLGLGYEAVRERNPGIIYASISGFGQSGPFRNRPAFEPVLQAMSGIMDVTGDPDRAPVRVRPAMIDYCTGASTAFAIAAALVRKAKTGRGERIDLALLDVALYAMSAYITHYKRKGELFPRTGSAHPATAPNRNFETRDGFICIAAGADHMWRALCKVLGIEDVGADPRYATQPLRAKNAREIDEIVNRETRKHAGRELEEKLLAASVPCGKVRNVSEILDEPHVRGRGMFEDIELPARGRFTTLRTPIVLSGKTAPLRRRAPLLGEHTRELLLRLGYSGAQIDELIAAGVAIQHEC